MSFLVAAALALTALVALPGVAHLFRRGRARPLPFPPAALVPAAGSPYYKAEYGNFLPLACLPIPFAEKANNPNF